MCRLSQALPAPGGPVGEPLHLHFPYPAQQGDVNHGLVLCGPRVGEIQDIISVAEVFRRLLTPVNRVSLVNHRPAVVHTSSW